MGEQSMRQTWRQICAQEDYVGRWVALDDCVYDDEAQPSSVRLGLVVDSYPNLASLCERLQAEQTTQCAILFCPPPAS